MGRGRVLLVRRTRDASHPGVGLLGSGSVDFDSGIPGGQSCGGYGAVAFWVRHRPRTALSWRFLEAPILQSSRLRGGEGEEVRSAIARGVLCGRYRLNPIPRRRFWSLRVEQSDLRWVQASMVFSDGRSYTGQSATPMVSRVMASTAFCVASASLTQFR